MSKSRPRTRPKAQSKQAQPPPARNYVSWFKRGLVLVFVLGFATAGLAAYQKSHATLHDLSVIGNGVPAVVQIHDPGCRLCQSLKRNAQAALGDLDGQLNYRIANIRTKEGRSLARRYDVPHVTLLFFDGDGQHTRTTNGVLREHTLEHLFSAHASKVGRDARKTEG